MVTWHVTIDSFTDACPRNWEEIASYLNKRIDETLEAAGEVPECGELSADGRDIADRIWEQYCSGEFTDCPEAIYDEEV